MPTNLPMGAEASWLGGGGTCPLASEIQKIFRNFRTLYQLRMCVMTSWDMNVNVRRKNIKMCPPLSPYPQCPCMGHLPPAPINKLALERLRPFTPAQVLIVDRHRSDRSRKGSWEGDVIGHCEGARDLQPCLARMEENIVRKTLKKCSNTCARLRGFQKRGIDSSDF